jgi:hypothetical protein
MTTYPRLLLASLVAMTAVAHAQPSDTVPAPPAPEAHEPSVALTWSPVHLLVPAVELTAEIRVAPKVGVGVIGGVGGTRIMQTNQLIKIVEAGISPRYYLLGSFRGGLELGFEALYVHAIADDFSGAEIRASGLGLSPYLGYKWMHRSGFTLEAQGGVSYLAFRGKGNSSSTSSSSVGALVNLQVGWSF